MSFSPYTPFVLSLSKDVLFLLQQEKGTCFDKLSTNGCFKCKEAAHG